MKKILFYCTSVLLAGIVCVSLKSSLPTHAVDSLFDSKGVPVKNVSKIFEHLGVSIDTLDQANEFAQKNLLRNGERWDTQEKKEWHAVIQTKKSLLLQDLAALGMISSVKPKRKFYKYILVMGATTPAVAHRLDYLAELKQNGVSFEEIVLLGGQRPLRDNEKEGLPREVMTEAQMMQYLCLNHPVLNKNKIMLVDAPMKQQHDGTFVRPNTDDTIICFQQTVLEDGSCLVISNNPYILRQTKVTQRLLDQTRFPTDGAGRKANQVIDIIVLMDEFARLIYEEYKQAKS